MKDFEDMTAKEKDENTKASAKPSRRFSRFCGPVHTIIQ
jgi:hypothetical protein